MHGMPHALPAVDRPAPLHRLPREVERQARVTDPLRTPLPGAARAAPLHAKLAPPRPRPVLRAQPVGLRHRTRQTVGEVRRLHSVASVPKIRLDTGVTIGPAHTIETSAS